MVITQAIKRTGKYVSNGVDILCRLSETPEQLPDGELYPEIDLMVLEIYGQYPTLELTSLTGNDVKFFNQGVGLLTAAKLRPGRPKRVSTGEIDSIRTATQQFSFSNLDRARVKNIELVETVWAAEGRTALGKVALIRAFNQANASAWSPLVLTGASRAYLDAGNAETLAAGDIRLLTDNWVVTETDAAGDYDDEDGDA